MDIKDNTLGIVGIRIGILVIISGGFAAYSNLSNQLVSTKAQLQQIEKERDDFKNQVDEKNKQADTQNKQIVDKDEELKNLRNSVKTGSQQIQEAIEENKRSKEETQILSACLSGVVEIMSAKNQANAYIALGGIKKECQSADKIIKKIQESQNEQPRSKSAGVGVSNLN